MTDANKELLSPFSWDNLELANRVAMAPMTRGRADEGGVPNAMMAEYYAQRASAGIIITEGTFISKEAIGWAHAPGIWSEEQMEAWKPIVNAVHREHTPIFVQLWHTGRASHSDFLDGDLPVAPSPVKHEGEPVRTPSGEKKEHETPRALDLSEIPRVVEDYRQAAEQSKAAGFDGIEIHAANGYLLDEFLQSKTNMRTDDYGGPVQNRFRLLREVIEACKTVFPVNRIGVRLSPNGVFNDMGSKDYRESFGYYISQLGKDDLAYLHVIDGLAFGFHELGDPMSLEEIRGLYPGRLMGNCGYECDDANRAIAKGHADMIAFGRPYIANPDLVERFANDWKFNELRDQDTWYSQGREGYIDYPRYQEADVKQLVSDVR